MQNIKKTVILHDAAQFTPATSLNLSNEYILCTVSVMNTAFTGGPNKWPLGLQLQLLHQRHRRKNTNAPFFQCEIIGCRI